MRPPCKPHRALELYIVMFKCRVLVIPCLGYPSDLTEYGALPCKLDVKKPARRAIGPGSVSLIYDGAEAQRNQRTWQVLAGLPVSSIAYHNGSQTLLTLPR